MGVNLTVFEKEVQSQLQKEEERKEFMKALKMLDPITEFRLANGIITLENSIAELEQLVENSHLYEKRIVKKYLDKVKRRKSVKDLS